MVRARIRAACSGASAGVAASFTPPVFPRPPACTCAFTTTAPSSLRATASASSGLPATSPSNMGMPAARKSARAWYSWRFTGASGWESPAGAEGPRAHKSSRGHRSSFRPGLGRAQNLAEKAERPAELLQVAATERFLGAPEPDSGLLQPVLHVAAHRRWGHLPAQIAPRLRHGAARAEALAPGHVDQHQRGGPRGRHPVARLVSGPAVA